MFLTVLKSISKKFYSGFHNKIVPLLATLATQKVIFYKGLKAYVVEKQKFQNVSQNQLQKMCEVILPDHKKASFFQILCTSTKQF